MFDSKEYGWNDISINILGRTLRGVVSIKYAKKADQSLLYGRGNEPIGIQTGNKSVEGELGLLQSEVQALQAIAKTQRLDVSDLRFDIIVSYANGAAITTDIVQTIAITDFEKAMKQGDKNMEIMFKYIALGIKYGE